MNEVFDMYSVLTDDVKAVAIEIYSGNWNDMSFEKPILFTAYTEPYLAYRFTQDRKIITQDLSDQDHYILSRMEEAMPRKTLFRGPTGTLQIRGYVKRVVNGAYQWNLSLKPIERKGKKNVFTIVH